MRVVFMGTPAFSARILEELCGQHQVVGVFTRSDAVSGRGSKPAPSPVKQMAQAHGVAVYEPDTLRDESQHKLIADLEPEAIIVAAYGKILPQEVLDIPRYGCLNVHTSMLPHWRGAAPVQRAILAGDQVVGVCIMRMEAGLDTGDYCVCRTTLVGDKPYPELLDELADLGATALMTALRMIQSGSAQWVEQPDAQATYAVKLNKGELFISPDLDARTAKLRIQASSPAHPARCIIASRKVTVVSACLPADSERHIQDKLAKLRPGRVLFFAKRLFLGCADGPVEVLSLRPDGKKTMDAKAFAAGVQNIKSGVISWEGL